MCEDTYTHILYMRSLSGESPARRILTRTIRERSTIKTVTVCCGRGGGSWARCMGMHGAEMCAARCSYVRCAMYDVRATKMLAVWVMIGPPTWVSRQMK